MRTTEESLAMAVAATTDAVVRADLASRMEVFANEETVTELSRYMQEEMGLEYDEDFTCLYGAGWVLSGIRAMTPSGIIALGNLAVGMNLEAR